MTSTGRTAKLLSAAWLFVVVGAQAQDVPPPRRAIGTTRRILSNFPNAVFFGDAHLHTSYSTDAGMLGNTLGPEEAYRFARGETVISSTGLPARLARPLDFLVISDHAENLGLAPALAEGNPLILKSEWGRMRYELVKQNTAAAVGQAFDHWMAKMLALDDPTKDVPTTPNSSASRCRRTSRRASRIAPTPARSGTPQAEEPSPCP